MKEYVEGALHWAKGSWLPNLKWWQWRRRIRCQGFIRALEMVLKEYSLRDSDASQMY